MASKGSVQIAITGDASDLKRAVGVADSSLGRLGQSVGRMGSGFATLARSGGLAAVAVGGALVAGLGSAVREAQEAAKIGRLTNAVIQSTGGAANVTAGQVEQYAEKLSNLTGVDDEAIQSGQNLLLTFTKVRNEVGEGNDVFDQATQAALDMSVALGTDMNGAAMQLGKALNDPIKGINALSRAGVSFTQQQKDQVKAMVEAGDVLGAQKIILAEMQTQFGGAAVAASDPMQRLGTIVGNLKESIGTALLPVVERIASWLGTHLPAAVDTAKDVIRDLFSAIQGGPIFEDSPLYPYAGFITRTVVPAFDKLRAAVSGIAAFMRDHWKPVLVAVGAALVALTSPVTAVAAGIAALYLRVESFRTLIDQKVIPAVQDAAVAIGTTFRKALADLQVKVGENRAQLEQLGRAITQVAGFVAEHLTPALTFLYSNVIKHVIGQIQGAITIISGLVRAFNSVEAAVQKVIGWFRNLAGSIRGAVGDLDGLLVGAGRDLIAGLVRGVREGADGVLKDTLGWVTRQIPEWKGPLSRDKSLLFGAGVAIMGGLASGIDAGSAEVKSSLDAVTVALEDAARRGAEVTREEELAILQSLASIRSAQEALNTAREEAKTPIEELRRLELELGLAQHEYNETVRESTSATDELAAAHQRLNDAISIATGGLGAIGGRADAQEGLQEARANRDSLLREQAGLPARIAAATATRNRIAADLRAARTSEDRAKQEERLAWAEERLTELIDRRTQIVGLLRDAEEELTDAQIRAVSAQQSLVQAGEALIGTTPAMQAHFEQIAAAAGLSRAEIQGLIDDLRDLNREINNTTKPRNTKPGKGKSLRELEFLAGAR